jgi:hypothetical protein
MATRTDLTRPCQFHVITPTNRDKRHECVWRARPDSSPETTHHQLRPVLDRTVAPEVAGTSPVGRLVPKRAGQGGSTRARIRGGTPAPRRAALAAALKLARAPGSPRTLVHAGSGGHLKPVDSLGGQLAGPCMGATHVGKPRADTTKSMSSLAPPGAAPAGRRGRPGRPRRAARDSR